MRITLTEAPVGKRKQYDANGDEMKYGRMDVKNVSEMLRKATEIGIL